MIKITKGNIVTRTFRHPIFWWIKLTEKTVVLDTLQDIPDSVQKEISNILYELKEMFEADKEEQEKADEAAKIIQKGA